jgi:SOS-response transcriptional repressor LexA
MNNYIALEVIGEEMAPTLIEGDLLIIDQSVQPAANGKDLAVFKIDGGYHVCRYTRFGKQFLMLYDNGPIVVCKADDAQLIGKVIDGTFLHENKENHSAANTMAFA